MFAEGLPLAHYEPIFRPGSAANILVALAACDEVRSETAQSKFFNQHDDGFASLGPCEGPCRGPFRAPGNHR